MHDLASSRPALTLPPIGASAAPRTLLADVPGLASDVERRVAALEAWAAEVDVMVAEPTDFRRLAGAVNAAVNALADAPARDLVGILAKARLLTLCPAIVEDDQSTARIGESLARDVVRLLRSGGHHAP